MKFFPCIKKSSELRRSYTASLFFAPQPLQQGTSPGPLTSGNGGGGDDVKKSGDPVYETITGLTLPPCSHQSSSSSSSSPSSPLEEKETTRLIPEPVRFLSFLMWSCNTLLAVIVVLLFVVVVLVQSGAQIYKICVCVLRVQVLAVCVFWSWKCLLLFYCISPKQVAPDLPPRSAHMISRVNRPASSRNGRSQVTMFTAVLYIVK